MSAEKGDSDELEVRFRVWPVLANAGPVGAWLLAAAGLYATELGRWRWLLVLATIALTFLTIVSTVKIRRSARNSRKHAHVLAEELERIRSEAPLLDPETVLRAAARPLFAGSGGWRMSVYVLESANIDEWWLRRIARVASSPKWEQGGRVRMKAEYSYLRELDNEDVTDPRVPYFGESGVLPGRAAEPDAWRELQLRVLSDGDVVDALRMPSRKYAWCATREEDGERRVVALVAETIDPIGMVTDLMKSGLIPAFLALVVKVHDAPMFVERAVGIGAELAGREGKGKDPLI